MMEILGWIAAIIVAVNIIFFGMLFLLSMIDNYRKERGEKREEQKGSHGTGKPTEDRTDFYL